MKIWEFIKSSLKSVYTWCIRHPAAITITIFLVVIAVILWRFGKQIQIGGMLGKIWGSKLKDKIKARTTVVPGRRDSQGNVIQPGTSDDKGYVQAPVSTDIKKPGVFSDPEVVEVVDNGKEVKIPLPTGVVNSDVKEVIRIKPNVYEVHNNDGGVTTHELSDLDKVLNP